MSRTRAKPLLVKGHALRREGVAHYSAACYEHPCRGGNEAIPSFAKGGHALCSCGQISVHLPTTRARRRWHRAHKAAVVAGAVEGGDGG